MQWLFESKFVFRSNCAVTFYCFIISLSASIRLNQQSVLVSHAHGPVGECHAHNKRLTVIRPDIRCHIVQCMQSKPLRTVSARPRIRLLVGCGKAPFYLCLDLKIRCSSSLQRYFPCPHGVLESCAPVVCSRTCKEEHWRCSVIKATVCLAPNSTTTRCAAADVT